MWDQAMLTLALVNNLNNSKRWYSIYQQISKQREALEYWRNWLMKSILTFSLSKKRKNWRLSPKEYHFKQFLVDLNQNQGIIMRLNKINKWTPSLFIFNKIMKVNSIITTGDQSEILKKKRVHQVLSTSTRLIREPFHQRGTSLLLLPWILLSLPLEWMITTSWINRCPLLLPKI